MKVLLIVWSLMCGADSATTHYAIATGRAYEAVWPVQNPVVLDAMNAGQCVAVSVAGAKLPRKIGVPLVIATTFVRGWAVQHNIREIR